MVLGFADEMKMLVDNLVASRDARLKAINNIMKDTHSTLKNFHTDRRHMSEEQKAELARFRNDLKNRTKELLADTQNMMDTFAKEHQEMAIALRGDLSKFHNKISRETHRTLNQFKANFEQMAEEQRKTLSGLHTMLSDYYKGEIKKPVHDMLNVFHNEMKKLASEFHQAHQSWISFSRSMDEKRHVKEAPEEIKPAASISGRKGGKKRGKHSRKR